MKKRSKRYMARVAVMKKIYCDQSGGQLFHDQDYRFDQEYYQLLLEGVTEHQALLDDKIAPLLDAGGLEDMMVIDRIILLIGAYELEYRPDVPWRVVVNEAIEMAKEYGSEEGWRMVNAVLDKLSISLRKEERA